MKRVFLLSKDKVFERNVQNSLSRVDYQVSTPAVDPASLFSYVIQFHPDILIIHNSYINGYYSLFDMILQLEKVYIVYGTPLMEEGACYNALSSCRFFMLDDREILGISSILKIMQRDVQIMEALTFENERLRMKVEEERLVKKAKLFLVEKKGMKEDAAYKLILKLAMDKRLSKAQVAKCILNEGMKK